MQEHGFPRFLLFRSSQGPGFLSSERLGLFCVLSGLPQRILRILFGPSRLPGLITEPLCLRLLGQFLLTPHFPFIRLGCGKTVGGICERVRRIVHCGETVGYGKTVVLCRASGEAQTVSDGKTVSDGQAVGLGETVGGLPGGILLGLEPFEFPLPRPHCLEGIPDLQLAVHIRYISREINVRRIEAWLGNGLVAFPL